MGLRSPRKKLSIGSRASPRKSLFYTGAEASGKVSLSRSESFTRKSLFLETEVSLGKVSTSVSKFQSIYLSSTIATHIKDL